MLDPKDVSSIAAILKVKAEDLQAKISSEAVEEIKLPTLHTFTDTELASRLSNEKSASYNEGKQAQEEMLVKAAKKDLGYEIDSKDFTGFMAHHDEHLKTKYSKDSSARVKELESDILKLNTTHSDLMSVKDQEVLSLRGEMGKQGIKNQLLSIMPKETTIASEDIITLFNANYEVQSEDGKVLIKKGGETLKNDTTAEPLGLKDVFEKFISDRKYTSKPEGRGEGNQFKTGSGVKTMDEFNAKWEASGKSTIGREYDEAYAAARKELNT